MVQINKILIIIALCLVSCNNQTRTEVDLQSIKPELIRKYGRFDTSDEVYLMQYIKNGQFDSAISNQRVHLKAISFDEIANTSSALISEIDYHNDFEIVFKNKSKVVRHRFSKVKIEEIPSKPFNFYLITEYFYDGKLYKDQQCDFLLNETNK